MTYKEAHDLYQKKYGGHVKSSYIADVLNSHGKLTNGKSPSRKGDYKYPCPGPMRNNLEKVLEVLPRLCLLWRR